MRAPRRLSSVLSLLAAAAGIVLFVHLFRTTDVLARLGDLTPALLWLVPAFALAAFLDTLSWVFAFPQSAVRPGLLNLFTIRLAGESINNALASAYVAGEPVKGLLTARYGTRPADGLASALVGKTTTILGEVAFLFLGVLAGWFVLDGESPLHRWMLTVAGGGLLVVLAGILLQRRRVFGRGARLLRALRLGPSSLWSRALPGADAIDRAVAGYYATQPRDFLVSTVFGLLGWVAGAVEIYVFLRVATPIADPLLLAIVIEAGIAVVKGLSFFIPASIGAQEGGIAWLFQVTGAGLDLGLVYAVFRRFREVVWIGLGFAALGWHLRRREAPAARTRTGEGEAEARRA